MIASSELGLGIGVRCSGNDACQGGLCEQGVCASACTTDGDCPKPSLCLMARCRLGCRQDSECTLPGTICDTGLGACRGGCKQDAQCGSNEICDQGALVCKVGCRQANEATACAAGKICEAEQCVDGCRPGAASTKPCASGQFCDKTSETVGACKPAIQIGAIVPGKTDASDAWSTSHRIALEDATRNKPFVYFKDKPFQLVEGAKKLDVTKAKLGELAGQGANAIAVTSRVGYDAVYADAAKYPATKFLAMGARDNASLPNVSSYRTNTDAGWYVMGRIAGRIVAPTASKCVGLILPTAGRQIVREANAFIMGARKQAPDAKVVIRWLGAGTDPEAASYTFNSASGFYSTAAGVKLNREELLTAQLADLGCAVIAHHTETQRSVAFVEKTLRGPFASHFGTKLFSLATDLQYACHADPLRSDSEYQQSCAGSLYWNWSAKYGEIFDLLKASTWEPRSTFLPWRAGADGVLQIQNHVATASVLGISPTDIAAYKTEMQNNPAYVFSPAQHGGIKFVGQRDLDKDGKPDIKQELFDFEDAISEPNELDRMCWFVEGAYEFPACATSNCTATLSTIVPAMVPYGPKMDPASSVCSARVDKCTSTLSSASTTDRAKYGDVIDFITLSPSIAGNAQAAMDCPSN